MYYSLTKVLHCQALIKYILINFRILTKFGNYSKKKLNPNSIINRKNVIIKFHDSPFIPFLDPLY